MKKCPSCSYQNNNDQAFCVSCGTSLKNIAVAQKVEVSKETRRKRAPNKIKYILVTSIFILAILMFTSYQLLSKKYQPETVIEQFKTALVNEDRASLKSLIQPDDERLKINDDSLDALFYLIDSEPSIMQDIIDDLQINYEDGFFYLEENGKHYGIFNRYVIGTKGYFLLLSDEAEGETTFYLNDEKIGTLDETEASKEFGPYLVGTYFIKAVSGTKKNQGEDKRSVTLDGIDTKTTVTFDTTPIELEEDTIAFEDIEDEEDQYIIPNSDKRFLDLDDIYHLSSSELRFARNEIFARHGYIFDSEELQNYFNQMDWYYPDSSYTGTLTSIEEYNVDFIKSLE